eukprot:GHVT01104234.1.p1 GENE.GHVT01104234.1~~GHVT01104234.1.p1  ORF type:complete len:148 (+),score=8.18 GHVT01104234.1:149-592(+)
MLAAIDKPLNTHGHVQIEYSLTSLSHPSPKSVGQVWNLTSFQKKTNHRAVGTHNRNITTVVNGYLTFPSVFVLVQVLWSVLVCSRGRPRDNMTAVHDYKMFCSNAGLTGTSFSASSLQQMMHSNFFKPSPLSFGSPGSGEVVSAAEQ